MRIVHLFEKTVGLSNILDSDLCGRHLAEGSHGQVVRAAVVDRKLLCEIVQRIECVARVEAFLVLSVAALDLTIMARGIRANQLMPDAQHNSRPLKQSRQLALTARKSVGKLGTVVRLDTLHLYASAGVPCS